MPLARVGAGTDSTRVTANARRGQFPRTSIGICAGCAEGFATKQTAATFARFELVAHMRSWICLPKQHIISKAAQKHWSRFFSFLSERAIFNYGNK